jgi:ADP-ribose pyrophosphatase
MLVMKTQSIEFCFQFCPHCGAKNPQSGSVPFRCQQCGFVNFFGPVAAVGGLVTNDDDQLLLVRRARDPGRGLWGLPGGFVDRNETVEQALVREVREETQLRITSSQYLMSYPNQYNYRGIVAPVIDFFFCCRVESADQLALADDELEHHLWIRPTRGHLDAMAFPSNRVAIEAWLGEN